MRTVLVVDDEPLIRWSVGERLLAEGYEVLDAGTRRSAIEQLRKGVDVVLLDCQLPDVDGLGVLRQISEIDPAVRVVLMTADTTAHSACEAMALGAFQVVTKPFSLDEIVGTVRRALETTQARREAVDAPASAARLREGPVEDAQAG